MFRPAEIPSKHLAHPALIEVLTRFSDNILLRDELGSVTRYGSVLELARSEPFEATRRRLVMCSVNNDIGGLEGYLALLAANAVPLMVSSSLTLNSLDALLATYQPDYVWLPQQQDMSGWLNAERYASHGGYTLIGLNNNVDFPALHDDLALLLSTSGSTGSSKYVRLSHQNVWSNASAIAKYLALSADELSITTLPPNYSYGLSILHSHLWVGAGLAVTNKTFFNRDFWSFLKDVGTTSLSGVPYHFEILKKLRFTGMDLPHLRTLTQAGGRMSLDLSLEYATYCENTGRRFFAMYGQTEASPRMSYVPAEQALAKAGTIGIPIPGGVLELQSDTGAVLSDAHLVGEMIYRGPNVSLGYAESRADLSLGDINCGVLHTGDLAMRDDDGYYQIVGRKKRFIKIFGNRVNLEDVELQLFGAEVDAACSGRDDMLEVYLTVGNAARALEFKKAVMTSLRIGAQGVAVYEVDVLPRNESGKLRYTDLQPEKARWLA